MRVVVTDSSRRMSVPRLTRVKVRHLLIRQGHSRLAHVGRAPLAAFLWAARLIPPNMANCTPAPALLLLQAITTTTFAGRARATR